ENGLDSSTCGDVTVIFARGTGETGNVGTISGPPMFKSLRAKLGDKVVVQGVDYPASAAGNVNMGAAGGPAMAESVKAARSKCPNSKIVLSGYSQGAMVVHNAFRQGVSSTDVSGAVLFGDPLKTQKVGDLSDAKIEQFCGTSDTICGTGTSPTGGHLSYGSVADEAADFAIQVAGL
ncbi:carbohydrate esterase family 5 protein, partial [Periconia macrospinosa]